MLERNSIEDAKKNEVQAIGDKGQMDEVLYDYGRSITRLHEQVEKEGQWDLRHDLAAVYYIRGYTLSFLDRLDDAIADLGRSIIIYQELVEKEGRRELQNNLADAFNDRGYAFRAQGQLDNAVVDFGRAIIIFQELVAKEDRKELRNELARTYYIRGITLQDQGQREAAVVDYGRSITLLQEQMKKGGWRELRNALASFFYSRGLVLDEMGRLNDAVTDYGRVITIRQELVEKEGRRELRECLADAYIRRSLTLATQHRLAEAVADFDRGLIIYQGLVEEEGQLKLQDNLAMADNDRSLAIDDQDWLDDDLAVAPNPNWDKSQPSAMNVLLISPAIPQTFWSLDRTIRMVGAKAVFPPLGLLTLAAMLPREWNLRVVDQIFQTISKEQWARCDLVMISGQVVQSGGILENIHEAKRRGKYVVVGGPWVFHCPEEIIKEGADIVVVGEAELVMDRLLAAIERRQTGLILAAEEMADMTKTPVPRYELINYHDYTTMAIQFTRGCPFNCDFCDVTHMLGRKVRQTFFNFTLENLRHFGILRALGASNNGVVRMILLQAGMAGFIGLGLGVGLATLFGKLFGGGEVAWLMPWEVLVLTAGCVLLIVIGTALICIRRVLYHEPAMVFRN